MADNPLIMAAGAASRRALRPPTAPVEEPSLAGRVLGGIATPFAMVSNAMDLGTGASSIRDTLAGKNPADQALTPFSEQNRTSGRDLNRQWGLAGPQDTWANWLGGLATEIALDPATYYSGGTSALFKGGGSVLRAAGLANKLSRLDRGKTLRTILEEVGKRQGAKVAAGKTASAMDAAVKQGYKWDDIVDQPVGSWLKVHGPFGLGPEMGVENLIGKTATNAIAGTLDKAQSYVSKSAPGRAASMLFDYAAGGKYKLPDQTLSRTLTDFRELGGPEHYKQGVKHYDAIQGVQDEFAKQAEPLFKEGAPLHGSDQAGVFDEAFQHAMETIGSNRNYRQAFAGSMEKYGIVPSKDLLDKAEAAMRDVHTEQRTRWQRLLDKGYKGSPNLDEENFSHFQRRATDELLKARGKARTADGFLHDSSATRAREPWLRKLPARVVQEISDNPAFREAGGPQAILDNPEYAKHFGYVTKEKKNGNFVHVTPKEHAEQLMASIASKKGGVAPGTKWYDINPKGGVRAYAEGVGRVEDTVDSIHDFIGQNLRETPTEGAKRVGEVYVELGMRRKQSVNHLASLLNMDPVELGKRFVDPEAFQAILDHMKPGKELPEFLKVTGDWWDKATAAYKTNWTLPRVPFHVRNRIGGETNTAFSGAFDDVRDWANYLRTAGREMASKNRFLPEHHDGVLDLTAHGVIGDKKPALDDVALTTMDARRGNPLDLGAAWREGGEQAKEKPWNLVGQGQPYIGPVVEKVNQAHKALLNAGSKAAGMTEYYNRVPYYKYLTESKGYTPQQAAKEVENLQFSYEKMTPAEKIVFRRAFPFWGFGKNQTKLTAKTLYNNPGGAGAATLRATSNLRNEDEPIPAHMQNTLAIPLGEQADGTESYLTGFGNPQEAAMPYLAAPGNVRGAGMELLSSSHPFLKYPLEMITRQAFFQRGTDGAGRPLKEMDPAISRLLGGEEMAAATKRSPYRMAAEHTLMNTPLSTYITTARTATDPRKRQNYGLALNLLSPVQRTDVSPQQQERLLQAASNAIADELGAKEWRNRYFPEEMIAAAEQSNPQAAATMKQLNAMWSQAKKNAAKYRAEKKKPASPRKDERAANELLRMAGL